MNWDSKKEIRVLLIEDDEDDYVITRDLFSEITILNFKLFWEPDFDTALQKLINEEYDIYLVDYRLGEHDGIEILREARKNGIKLPIILLTGQGDKELDLLAMREGAADYLVKGNIDSQTLSRSMRYSLNSMMVMQELNEKERKYRILFEKSIDAIYVTNKELLFMDVNSSMIRLLGYDKNQMLLMNLKDLFVNEINYIEFKEDLMKYGKTRDYEVLLKNSEGNAVECLINSTAMGDVEGEILGFQGIIHDISLRKRAEQELIMAEKFSMTGKIARSIAHEVRNPLTNLNLALEQLKDEIEENEMVELYADIIKRNADRIDQLITEMLNSSKPKQLNLKEENLNELVEETLQLTYDRLNLKNMKLHKEYQENIPPLMLDSDKFKMAILNIVINAVEAMEDAKGVLEVKTFTEKDDCIVWIHDNGKGIPHENLNKLFDPFFTGKKGGMGLGLTTTQNIINSHKGRITVESPPEKGTIFKIILRKEARPDPDSQGF